MPVSQMNNERGIAIRVGVPRALSHYHLYPFFRTILNGLGVEVVVSPQSNSDVMEYLHTCPTDEPCLPVKQLFAHVRWLQRKGNVHFIWLPRITSVFGNPCCPKTIGAPDMVFHALNLVSSRVLMPTIDITDDPGKMVRQIEKVAAKFGQHNPRYLKKLLAAALFDLDLDVSRCVEARISPVDLWFNTRTFLNNDLDEDAPRIAILGQPYLIYDKVCRVIADYINPRAIIITPEMVSQSKIDKAVEHIPDADEHLWHLERQVLGAGLHLINSGKVEKVINVTAFGCGTSLVTEPYLTGAAEDAGIPLLNLIIDEHTGEAGILTRLEAFIDTAPFDSEPPAKYVVPLHIEKRVVGYPSMGHVDIGFDSFFADLGVDYITAPRTSTAIIELGRDLAPEFACFPFISTLGQMQNLLDNGANTILMVGGKGLCRLGWYGQIQELLLRRTGREFDMVVADSFLPLTEKLPAFIKNISKLTNNAPWHKLIPSFLFSLDKIRTADNIIELVRELRAYEDVRGAGDELLKKHFTRLRQITSKEDLKTFARQAYLEIASVPKSETNPLKVRLTGEIWVLLEQEATNYLERWIATAMPHRVLVDCRHSVMGWYDDHVLGQGKSRQQRMESQKAAEGWLASAVGGHGLESVGDVVLASKEDIDGVIHIFPFTCMPEIVAQNIIVSASESLDIPVLTYVVSEQSGEAGMATRLEAFLDVLEARKNVEN